MPDLELKTFEVEFEVTMLDEHLNKKSVYVFAINHQVAAFRAELRNLAYTSTKVRAV